ncbi:hypothetical protein [Ktedonobacter robiniae]|uniref:Uncharacterized protein n=1 Tax=Ktedonobacter robiniae TaxID=2778365 RepID=A0ABQ3UY62_9CHLR|nr:hypothetical protein [Ktedonobacter robiniae]GHO57607.1 hypothetical protein KSB_60820 [Ktedonobacter robiniae]
MRTQTLLAQHEERQEGSELASIPLQHTRLFEHLHDIGYCGVEEQRMMLDFSAGILYQASMRTNAESFFYQLAPVFYQTTDLTPTSFEEIFEQMRAEMSAPTFKGFWTLSRMHAYKPGGVQ